MKNLANIHIVISDVSQSDRVDVEKLEGEVFETREQFFKSIYFKADLYSLPEYTNGINNEELDCLTSHWVTYIYINSL